MDTISLLKQDTLNELHSILGYWEKNTIDFHQEGFIGQINYKNETIFSASKGAVLNTRILWAFSAAHSATQKTSYFNNAYLAFNYIEKYFIDKEFGGLFWTVDYSGSPATTKKQVYAQAFAIYSLSEFYKISKSETAKRLAVQIYSLLEKYAFDKCQSGYFEAFSRDWKHLEDVRLSNRDANERKTMNTHLHILEAYTNLFTIWPDLNLKNRIRDLLDIFHSKIIDMESGHLHTFFSEDWQIKHDSVSYGHDIEASWLLLEAAEIINEKKLIEKFKNTALIIAEATIPGIDTDGGLWYELNPVTNETIREKHWWVQAEAVVGFLNAWQVSGENRFLQYAIRCWQFIKEHIVDTKNGEWVWGIDQNYKIMDQDKVGLWKCPYHNVRACLEVLKRLS
ncbi:MAG: AGE family epimerase/isomerase [Bacteroidota bacterium]